MIARHTQIKRSAAPRKRRPGVRRGQPTKAEKSAERTRAYERSGGQCELRDEHGKPLHPQHRDGVLPAEGDVRYRWHLVHLHSKRRFGWTEKQRNVLLGGCFACHIFGMHQHGLKPMVRE